MGNQFLKLIFVLALLQGCIHRHVEPVAEKKEEPEVELLVKYSDEPNLAPASDRDYRRMTRQRMEDESGLNAGAGSLWVMEGQTSYLFAQNKQRKPGDRTQVKLEGSGLKQLEMKVAAITDLLAELELQKKVADEKQQKLEEDRKIQEHNKLRLAAIDEEVMRIKASGEMQSKSNAEIHKTAEDRINARMPAMTKLDVKPVVAVNTNQEKVKPDVKEAELIPSKIIEKMPDGLYRISGQQFLTIKNRPYKVITTGLVRPDDFSDDVISSTKIYEPQIDVIHIKKTEKF